MQSVKQQRKAAQVSMMSNYLSEDDLDTVLSIIARMHCARPCEEGHLRKCLTADVVPLRNAFYLADRSKAALMTIAARSISAANIYDCKESAVAIPLFWSRPERQRAVNEFILERFGDE